MATYVFKATDLSGVQAKGEVEAESKQAVAEQLKERGLVVVDIAAKYRSKELNIDLFSKVNAKDLAVASRQLATMVTSGMSIMRALHVLETQTGSKLGVHEPAGQIDRDMQVPQASATVMVVPTDTVVAASVVESTNAFYVDGPRAHPARAPRSARSCAAASETNC